LVGSAHPTKPTANRIGRVGSRQMTPPRQHYTAKRHNEKFFNVCLAAKGYPTGEKVFSTEEYSPTTLFA